MALFRHFGLTAKAPNKFHRLLDSLLEEVCILYFILFLQPQGYIVYLKLICFSYSYDEYIYEIEKKKNNPNK